MIISFALSADFRIFSILFFLDQSVFDINDNGNSILRLIGSNWNGRCRWGTPWASPPQTQDGRLWRKVRSFRWRRGCCRWRLARPERARRASGFGLRRRGPARAEAAASASRIRLAALAPTAFVDGNLLVVNTDVELVVSHSQADDRLESPPHEPLESRSSVRSTSVTRPTSDSGSNIRSDSEGSLLISVKVSSAAAAVSRSPRCSLWRSLCGSRRCVIEELLSSSPLQWPVELSDGDREHRS